MQNQNNAIKDIQILVATHKEYIMPDLDLYLPIHVGKEGKKDIQFIGDNTGDHISYKNTNYCELTALYWAWKNMNCKYIGLCHYRRYFANKDRHFSLNHKDPFSDVLRKEQVQLLLNNYDIILPKKRNYVIETVRDHYANAHYLDDLKKTEQILKELYPDYMDAFEVIMNGRKLHLFNMFVMKKELFDEYAEWLFSILFELEKRVSLENYSAYQARIFGFLSERLFNVWIQHNQLRVKELNIVCLEKENKWKKYMNFLKRKVQGNANGAN